MAGVLVLLGSATRVPELAWLSLPLMPVYLLLALPLGALAGRLARVPRPGRTAFHGWLLALVVGEVLAWLPSGYDGGARAVVVGPFLALFALPVMLAVVAGLTTRGRGDTRAVRDPLDPRSGP
ncbi:hypothetical protein GCM10022226_10150 [Sphaerisporangium flaviroseum]|uniref:Apolipoprotein N-acyltransferase n=1 Tax=Sphaerisporangium flaviroseum TaxID=509199 RepID=A0ABP7HHY7_9ACTN